MWSNISMHFPPFYPSCHPAILSSLSSCHSAILPSCYTVILPSCHPAILSSRYPANPANPANSANPATLPFWHLFLYLVILSTLDVHCLIPRLSLLRRGRAWEQGYALPIFLCKLYTTSRAVKLHFHSPSKSVDWLLIVQALPGPLPGQNDNGSTAE